MGIGNPPDNDEGHNKTDADNEDMPLPMIQMGNRK